MAAGGRGEANNKISSACCRYSDLFPASLRNGEVVLDISNGIRMTRLQNLLGHVSHLVDVCLLNTQLLLKLLHEQQPATTA